MIPIVLLARLDLLFVFLAVSCALGVVYTQRLLTLAILMTAFSFTSSGLFFIFDAVDVAFTEAAVGVSISTILFLATIIFVGDISGKKFRQRGRRVYPVEALVMLSTLVLLVFLLKDAPLFGSEDAKIHAWASSTYISATPRDFGIKNVVSAILAGYRGYDTLGETFVVLIAYLAVSSIFPEISHDRVARRAPVVVGLVAERHLVLRIVSKSMLPVIGLFALYVQFHGDNGPGGGFQAGVILATCCVIYGLLYGFKRATDVFSERLLLNQAVLGLGLYVGVGVFCLARGYSFLDYHAFDFLFGGASAGQSGQHLGIFFVELGVGLTVSAVAALIYLAFISHTTPLLQKRGAL